LTVARGGGSLDPGSLRTTQAGLEVRERVVSTSRCRHQAVQRVTGVIA
jgi:hypothetical protein